MTAIPSIQGHWLLGSMQERASDPLPLYVRAARMGPVSSFRAAWVRLYLLNHPEPLKHVLVDHPARYSKGRIAASLRPLVGNGILLSEGEVWKRNRRLAQPAFHRSVLARLAEGMVEETEVMLARWAARPDPAAPFDIAAEMMALTMAIIGRALFSADVTQHAVAVSRALTVVLEEANRRALSVTPWLPHLPTARQRAFREALGTLESIIRGIIQGRRGREAEHPDLLSMLMTAKDEDTGGHLSDEEVRDEVMTLFFAGHETTANALAWLWYLLSLHPDVELRVREELSSVLGGRAMQAEDLSRLKYSTRVFEETLRLYPPAWLFVRQALAEDQVGPYRLPKDALVMVSPYAIHRIPEFWPDPERFDPDRFLPERVQARPRLTYLPFGGGQRLCIGNNLAMMEAVVIMSSVLQRYRLEVVPGQTIEPEPLITLRPRHGIHVRAHCV